MRCAAAGSKERSAADAECAALRLNQAWSEPATATAMTTAMSLCPRGTAEKRRGELLSCIQSPR